MEGAEVLVDAGLRELVGVGFVRLEPGRTEGPGGRHHGVYILVVIHPRDGPPDRDCHCRETELVLGDLDPRTTGAPGGRGDDTRCRIPSIVVRPGHHPSRRGHQTEQSDPDGRRLPYHVSWNQSMLRLHWMISLRARCWCGSPVLTRRATPRSGLRATELDTRRPRRTPGSGARTSAR